MHLQCADRGHAQRRPRQLRGRDRERDGEERGREREREGEGEGEGEKKTERSVLRFSMVHKKD
jgi:hypothetical protein